MNSFITLSELDQLRQDTPGCLNTIHLNNAGSSMPPDVVVDTVVDYLREEALKGGYETESKYHAAIEKVYDSLATLINAHKDEIALFENASAAWTTAFKGLNFQPGEEIITCELEYATSLLNLIDMKDAGVKVTVISNDANGHFPLDQLEAAVSGRTRLIAVTHISSSGGGMLPVRAIGEIARKHQVLYLLDACQSVGQFPIDVKAIGCDMLSGTGRKYLRAPRGTGFLFVRKDKQDALKPLIIDQHAAQNIRADSYELRPDARRFELYEKNRGLVLGLGKAADYALGIGMDRIWARIKYLAAFTRQQLNDIPGVKVEDIGEELCGIVTISADSADNMILRDALRNSGINVSFSGASATLLYMSNRHLQSVLRVSVHYYNTEGEIIKLCETIRTILKV